MGLTSFQRYAYILTCAIAIHIRYYVTLCDRTPTTVSGNGLCSDRSVLRGGAIALSPDSILPLAVGLFEIARIGVFADTAERSTAFWLANGSRFDTLSVHLRFEIALSYQLRRMEADLAEEDADAITERANKFPIRHS